MSSTNKRSYNAASRSSGRSSLPPARRVGVDYYGGYIEIAEENSTCYIRVVGLGSLTNGTPLRRYMKDAQERGVTEFLFDMEQCQGMDSTFMGLIGWIAIDMGNTPRGIAMLLNLDEYNRDLLRQLGIHNLIDEGEAVIPDDLEWFRLDPEDATALERAKLAYEAHEKLSRIQPENRNRFYEFMKRLGRELFPFMKDEKSSDE